MFKWYERKGEKECQVFDSRNIENSIQYRIIGELNKSLEARDAIEKDNCVIWFKFIADCMHPPTPKRSLIT